MNAKESPVKSRAAYFRLYRYGITDKEFKVLLEKQGNKCAVCRSPFTEDSKPNVDHDHNCCPQTKSCGQCLRGLLCSRCITMASMVETRFKYMNDMLVYLHQHLINRMGGE